MVDILICKDTVSFSVSCPPLLLDLYAACPNGFEHKDMNASIPTSAKEKIHIIMMDYTLSRTEPLA